MLVARACFIDAGGNSRNAGYGLLVEAGGRADRGEHASASLGTSFGDAIGCYLYQSWRTSGWAHVNLVLNVFAIFEIISLQVALDVRTKGWDMSPYSET